MTNPLPTFIRQAAMPASRLIQRHNGTFDLEASAGVLLDALDGCQDLSATVPRDTVGKVLLNLQRVNPRDGQLLGVYQTLEIDVMGLDDQEGLKNGLVEVLDTLEQIVADMPVGQRVEVLVGVRAQGPTTTPVARRALGR